MKLIQSSRASPDNLIHGLISAAPDVTPQMHEGWANPSASCSIKRLLDIRADRCSDLNGSAYFMRVPGIASRMAARKYAQRMGSCDANKEGCRKTWGQRAELNYRRVCGKWVQTVLKAWQQRLMFNQAVLKRDNMEKCDIFHVLSGLRGTMPAVIHHTNS